MSSAKIIEELSQFYDIKYRVIADGAILYYMIYRDINIDVSIRYPGGKYPDVNARTLKANINKIIPLIDKLYEIFEFTYEHKVMCDTADTICIGSAKIYFQFNYDYIRITNLSFECYYSDVCDVIEYLKQACPKYIKSTDIKIALK